MEALLAFVAATIGAAVWYSVKNAAANQIIQTYGPMIKNVYDVIDPIAGDLIKSYSGSQVQEAIELAVLRVADGDIDQDDVNAVVSYVADKFDPLMAASKILDPSTQKGAATAELAESLKKLTDGADFDELKDVARKASAIL
jgi:hypothetical protein